MAEIPRRKSKKVEQKGRFTITEIISTPPASSRPFSPQEFMESLRETSQNVPKEADTPPDQMIDSLQKVGYGTEELTYELSQQVTGLDHRRAKVDNMRDDLRVKRKGRFTIIELASDLPSSRASFDEDDFKTTTTIPRATIDTTNVSSVYPQVSRGLTKSSSDKRLGQKDQADTRRLKGKSMSSIEKQQYMDKSYSAFDGNGNTVGGAAGIHHSPVDSNQIPLGGPPLAHANSFSSLSSETSSTSFDGGAIERRQSLDPNIGRRHLAPRQKNNMVTISTAQFQQQQQIISALAQQQEEFKRMIQVLQEQQQQLVNLPMQFGQSHFGSDESAQVMLRDLHYQNEALQRENEQLQLQLRVTKEEASQLMEENEVLIEMNAELNARCTYLENRFGLVNQSVPMGLSNSMNNSGSPTPSPGPSTSNSPNIYPPAPDLQSLR